MIKKKNCQTWEEFEDCLRELRECRQKQADLPDSTWVSDFLFRGQGNNCWSLRTTLDRTNGTPQGLSSYSRLILIARSQVETFTQKRWDFSEKRLEEWVCDYSKPLRTAPPGYEFLVYLRHHGFPSPLLDWTRSPYIAAYFAFECPKADEVAIFVYCEYWGGGKTGESREPCIMSFGPNIRSHERHFLQQGEYTMAAKYQKEGWYFCPHECVLDYDTEQDRSWKFVIPTSERTKVLKVLDSYNLNAYSLFQTEESLLRTIAIRELCIAPN